VAKVELMLRAWLGSWGSTWKRMDSC